MRTLPTAGLCRAVLAQADALPAPPLVQRRSLEIQDALGVPTQTQAVLADLASAVRDKRAPVRSLKGAVVQVVRELKGRGVPPEQVLVLVKEAVDGPFAAPPRSSESRPSHDQMIDQVVKWCIAALY